MDDAGPGGAGRQSSTSAPGGAYVVVCGARGSLSASGGTRGAAPCGGPRGGGPRGAAPCGGGPRGGRATPGGLWRGECQLFDDAALALLRAVSYHTFEDALLPALRAVSCQAAGGDGEPVVEAADSRGVYQRSSSRRAIALLWLPLFWAAYPQ